MDTDDKYYLGGLKLILFQLQYLDPNSLPKWDDKSIDYFKQAYPGDRIKRIGDGIKWYMETKKVDVSNLLPDINYSTKEVTVFLEYVLKGLVDSGLYHQD